MSTDPERIRRLLALADGQIEGAERAALEAGLSADERRLVKDERCLVSSAREALGGSGAPDALWARLKDRMQAPAAVPAPRLSIWAPGALGPAVAAALLLSVGLTAALTVWAPSGLEESLVSRAAIPVSRLGHLASVGPDRRASEAWLSEAGFALDLERVQPLIGGTVMGGHKVCFLGVSTVTLGRERVANLLFDCCGESVQVLVVRKASGLARQVEVLAASPAAVRMKLATRSVGDMLAFTVSTHGARDLLDLLGPLLAG